MPAETSPLTTSRAPGRAHRGRLHAAGPFRRDRRAPRLGHRHNQDGGGNKTGVGKAVKKALRNRRGSSLWTRGYIRARGL